MALVIVDWAAAWTRFCIKSTVNQLNETVEGSTCLISKTSLISKQITNILPNISQLMLNLISCHENALRKLAIINLILTSTACVY